MFVHASIATAAALITPNAGIDEDPGVRCESNTGSERSTRTSRRGRRAAAFASSRSRSSSSSSSSVSVSSSSSSGTSGRGRSRARAVSSTTDDQGRTVTVVHDERGCRVFTDPAD